MTEIVATVRAIAAAVPVPVICDADTGWGSARNVWRAVREYERGGAPHRGSGVPKRCGFLAGKQIVPTEDMVATVRAAVDARTDLVIIARTDALAVAGWDAARRARAYHQAGADLVFVDGVRTAADLDRYAELLADLPRLYNGALAVDEVARRGFRVMIHLGTMLATFAATRDVMRELRADGACRRRRGSRHPRRDADAARPARAARSRGRVGVSEFGVDVERRGRLARAPQSGAAQHRPPGDVAGAAAAARGARGRRRGACDRAARRRRGSVQTRRTHGW
jgi:2-methylisocitrate lyase-like PEP mutase family enzyme